MRHANPSQIGSSPSPSAPGNAGRGHAAIGRLRDGATVNAGINTVQTLTLAPNLTGGSFTLWFRIENESGEHILVETAAIDFDATALA